MPAHLLGPSREAIMPSAVRTALAALALLLACAPAPAADPTPEQIARWVRELDDDSFDVRENASKQLWAAGRAAEPALKEAARSSSAEVRLRAQTILDKFKWGIYPDTPPEVIALVNQARVGDGPRKRDAVKGLMKLGGPGCVAVIRMAAADDSAERRSMLGFITLEAS